MVAASQTEDSRPSACSCSPTFWTSSADYCPTVAVFAYRVLLLAISSAIGIPALVSLQREIRDDSLDVRPPGLVALPASDA